MIELSTYAYESCAYTISEYGEEGRHDDDHPDSVDHIFFAFLRSRPYDMFELWECMLDEFDHKKKDREKWSEKFLARLYLIMIPRQNHFKIPSRGCQR